MSKYDPLEGHLRRQKVANYEMTFRDIERVLGALLPRAAYRAEWWTNEGGAVARAVHSTAWLRAVYRAIPDVSSEKVHFERSS